MFNDFQDFWDKKWKKVDQIWPTGFALETLSFLWNKKWNLLDLWSWSWRDSLYFSKNWFDVEAFDFSENALNYIKQTASENDLSIKTTIWNIKDYEFGSDKYDFIYSCNSLYYFSFNDTKIIFEKIKKSLKKDWLIFIRVKSIFDLDFWKGEKLEENYYKNWEDIKHYFSLEYMKSLFSDFDIIYLGEVSENHNKIKWDVVVSSFIDIYVKKN